MVVAAVTVPLLAQEQAAAPAQPQGPPQVTVSVIDTAAPPEWELSVPVDAAIAAGAEVGSLTLRLVYPSKPLSFVRARATDKLKTAGFDVKASAPVKTSAMPPVAPSPTAKKAEAGKPQESSAITLTFTPAAASAKALTPGRLAILVFKVAKDADEKSYDVWTEAVQAQGLGQKPEAVRAAAGKPAIFIVTPPGLPILSCFFYMH